jgi:hypothetical protein
MAPYGVEQVVLGDQRSRSARQCTQYGERFGREPNGLPVTQQTGIGFVEIEWTEGESQLLRRGSGCSTLTSRRRHYVRLGAAMPATWVIRLHIRRIFAGSVHVAIYPRSRMCCSVRSSSGGALI